MNMEEQIIMKFSDFRNDSEYFLLLLLLYHSLDNYLGTYKKYILPIELNI